MVKLHSGEEELRLLWSDSPIVRIPGVAFFFSGPKPGLPPVLQVLTDLNDPILHVRLAKMQVPSTALAQFTPPFPTQVSLLH